MMRPITDPNDERVRAPDPTLDMPTQFGAGKKSETNDTGAGIVEREMQVEVTSPSIRATEASSPDEQVNKDLISPRRTNVHVRSGNTNWKTGVSTHAAPEQTAVVGTRDFLPGMGILPANTPRWMLWGGAALLGYLAWRGFNR